MAQGVLGTSAVVGTTVPIAVGYALAQKALATGRVVASFFGDGATEEGAFYESLNFASLRRLPVLFVCENNFLAIHEPITKRQAADRLLERVATFDLPAARVTSGDVFEIYDRTMALLDHVRTGKGPAFLECHTYRWREHVGPGEDYDAGYRDRAELTAWQAKDPIALLGSALPPEQRQKIETEIERLIEDALFWYFFGFMDLETMAFRAPVFLVPSHVVHTEAVHELRGGLLHYNFEASMKPKSRDKWRPYACDPAEVAGRVVKALRACEGDRKLKVGPGPSALIEPGTILVLRAG